jgi:hypothetical protein
VNRGLEDVGITITFDGYAVEGEIKVNEISGEDIDSLNTVFIPGEIQCTQSESAALNNRICCELMAHSIYSIETRVQRIES